MTPNPERRLVSIPQACELAAVSRRSLYTWMNDGKVEFILTAGGRRRIYADTLFSLTKAPPPAPLPKFPQGPLIPPGPSRERILASLNGRQKLPMAKMTLGHMDDEDFLRTLTDG